MFARKRPLPEIGQKFDMLTVIAAPFCENRYWRIPCRCDCGVEKVLEFGNLYTGNSTNCGCRRNEIARIGHTIHDEARRGNQTRLYRIWCGMIARCEDVSSKAYRIYGACGISVCQEWRKDYIVFKSWALSHNYSDDLSIDRIDSNGNYSPANCRWATWKQQNRNRKNSIVLTAFGETKLLVEWVEDARCTVSRRTLYWRIHKLEWEAERAITTPTTTK